MAIGEKVYFTDAQRAALGNIAETARTFLYRNPSRDEFDTWQTAFLAIAPSFYPLDSSEVGELSQETILPQYQDAQHRLYSQTV